MKKLCDDCKKAEAIVHITRASEKGSEQIGLCVVCFQQNAAAGIKGAAWTSQTPPKR